MGDFFSLSLSLSLPLIITTIIKGLLIQISAIPNETNVYSQYLHLTHSIAITQEASFCSSSLQHTHYCCITVLTGFTTMLPVCLLLISTVAELSNFI